MQGNKRTDRKIHRKGLKPRKKSRRHREVLDPISLDGIPELTPHALFPSERKMVLDVFSRSGRPGLVRWAAENVKFTREYDACVFEGPWDPDLTPFWHEPMEALTDLHTREIKILKCSQAGATENLILNFMRYSASVLHWSMLMVVAQELMAKNVFEHRVMGGIEHCVRDGQSLVDGADVKWARLLARWPDFRLQVGWAKSKTVMKGDPWRIVLLDEVSTYPADALDKLRKRLSTWQDLGKLLVMSAMDKEGRRAAADDPMLLEYKKSDQRKYAFPDRNGTFVHEFGYDQQKRVLLPHGIRFSPKAKRDDGTWDLDAVEESAYYLTPGGLKLSTEDRNQMLRNGDGRWVVTNPEHSDKEKGYHVPSFLLPWVSYGSLARRFVSATTPNISKPKLRIFILEDLAEEWEDVQTLVRDDELKERRAAYQPGQVLSEVEPYKTFYIGANRMVFGTWDVQQMHFRYVFREWIKGEFTDHRLASGLIDEGEAVAWEDVDDLTDRNKADFCFFDNNYKERRTEVAQACFARKGFVTCIGKDTRMNVDFQMGELNPFEGTRRGNEGHKIPVCTYDTDVFRSALMGMLLGELKGVRWYVPQTYRREYWRQLLSTEKKDGVWKTRPGFKADHAFDCEVLQVLAATVAGLREWGA